MNGTEQKTRRDWRGDIELFVALAVAVAVTLKLFPQWANGLTERGVIIVTALLLVAIAVTKAVSAMPARRRNTTAPPGAVATPPQARKEPDRPKRWSMDLLMRLEWRRFEQLCALYFDTVGGFRAVVKPPSAVGSHHESCIRLLDRIDDEAPPVGLIKCSAMGAPRISVRQVERLYEAMLAEHGHIALFVTTGDYSEKAELFARAKRLRLLSGTEFLARLTALPSDTQQALLAEVTQGDYTTPTCPRCGVKMVRRIANKQMSSSRYFWACVNDPRCKQTFRLRRGQQGYGQGE